MSIDRKNKGLADIKVVNKKLDEESNVTETIDDLSRHQRNEFYISVEEEKRKFFAELLDGQEIIKNNESLTFISGYFDELLVDLSLEDSNFFDDENNKLDFIKRLENFDLYIENHLSNLDQLIPWDESCVNFSDHWRENLKKAAYYVFFVHYGEKRKGEFDEDGKPLDYVYHVVNTSLSNLIVKVRFFCEPTVIAAMFHDVLENWDRGLISKLNLNNSDVENPGKLF